MLDDCVEAAGTKVSRINVPYYVIEMKSLFLAMALVFSLLVGASFIQITTTVGEAYFQNTSDEVELDVSVKNTGDEPAHSVMVSLTATDYLASNKITKSLLGVSEEMKGKMSLTILESLSKNLLPGTYPSALVVDYKDANGYPFSAISPLSVSFKEKTTSLVQGVFKGVTLYGRMPGRLDVEVRNLDEAPHRVSVKLVTSRELKSLNDSFTVYLDRKSEKTISFDVSSLGALPDSSYTVLAFASYEEKGLFYSSVARGVVKVEKESDSSLYLAIIAVLMVGGVGAVAYFVKFRNASL
ncbi:hypothetical protein HY991_04040 [Candidatus Micrarchaeota archaeon]|nr:hypothetical protein [Candidatus Micrarchaeota archaeon]